MASGGSDFDSPGDAAVAGHLASVFIGQRIDHPPDISDRSKVTTAFAESSSGLTMKVSFWMDDHPTDSVALLSAVCSKSTDATSSSAEFKVEPHVVGAEGPFILLRARFSSGCGQDDEYFMCKASCSEPPLLEWIRQPDDDRHRLYSSWEFGIVLTDRRDHYLLAALGDAHHAPSDYQLRIYSSEMKAWSSKTLHNPCSGLQKIIPEKVIRLGEGILGWVDFSRGLVACDLQQDPPGVRFIPLPEPLPENRDKLKGSPPGAAARSFRDLACINGVLKFVEMEHRVVEKPIDPADKDFLYDSDLIMSLKREEMDEKPISSYGWRAVTWSRMVWSNFWRKECTFGVDDFLANESTPSSMSGLQGKAAGNLAFRHLYSAFPTLSTEGNDILYLKSVAEPSDQSGWVVALDLGNKTVKAQGGFKDRDSSKCTCHSGTLSCHLIMNPGIEVSVCCLIRLTACSAHDLKNKSIYMDEPISCRSVSKLPRPKKVSSARKESRSVVKNDNVSQLAWLKTMR